MREESRANRPTSSTSRKCKIHILTHTVYVILSVPRSRRMIADVLQEIQQYQNTPYCLHPEQSIQVSTSHLGRHVTCAVGHVTSCLFSHRITLYRKLMSSILSVLPKEQLINGRMYYTTCHWRLNLVTGLSERL